MENNKLKIIVANIDKRTIIFKQIGKKAKVHKIVNDAYRIKRADTKITANEVIRYLNKKESGVW